MRILTAIVAVGLLFAAASGCNKNKNDKTTPNQQQPAQPQYPPAQ
jgi:hypothetical protein